MKVILTTSEIIRKLGLPTDTELVVEQDQKINADGWISNIGHDRYGYPDSLPIDAEIEVRFRTGETNDRHTAGEWCNLWKETDGTQWDIVAYRILN